MKLGDREHRALKPDAQAFDKIVIETVPRYKTSGLSGDEWRISARIQFWRKGARVHEDYAGNVDYACQLLNAKHIEAIESGKGFYAGEGDTCDQEGCAERGTNKLYLRKEFCKQGHGTEVTTPTYRLFCDKHKTRGDCGLDDADSNYENRPEREGEK